MAVRSGAGRPRAAVAARRGGRGRRGGRARTGGRTGRTRGCRRHRHDGGGRTGDGAARGRPRRGARRRWPGLQRAARSASGRKLPAGSGTLPTRPLADPAPPGTRAWAAAPRPAVLRCGLTRPAELTPTSALLEVNGVRWLRLDDGVPDPVIVTYVAVDAGVRGAHRTHRRRERTAPGRRRRRPADVERHRRRGALTGQRKPAFFEHTGHAFQPCVLSTRSATLICSALLALCAGRPCRRAPSRCWARTAGRRSSRCRWRCSTCRRSRTARCGPTWRSASRRRRCRRARRGRPARQRWRQRPAAGGDPWACGR